MGKLTGSPEPDILFNNRDDEDIDMLEADNSPPHTVQVFHVVESNIRLQSCV
jgi:hypothetical protein